ncbi:ParB/RepB/Spo0J family partition protein [Sphaerisporangium sp. NBC_01403]|uniref:ParB/RepB/Spo0J family partition protein n=1 Tax=Sphaerisporangium sp. NBC_01403 TaxID=2903599 RepID=UPI003255874C
MAQQRRGGLGKGLGALIPTGPIVEVPAATGAAPETSPAPDDGLRPVAGAYFMEIPLEAITRNPRQPREIFDEDALRELADSIREVGLLQPIVVRSVGGGRYELIMGERRWRASQLLDLKEIPAIVRSTQDDELLRDALIENLQREQLNALEEAAAYRQLLDDFGATHEQLAQRVGRSRSHISNTLRLLNLPANVQLKVAAGTISAGHARALLGLSDPAAQERLAARIFAEGLSVRTVEEIVSMGEATAAPAPKTRRAKDAPEPALVHLATRLSDHFETRVKVDLGRHKGRIVVEFATMDDLERIIGAMAPGAATSIRALDD